MSGSDKLFVDVEFVPTVPHCSLATLIGLCLRVKLSRDLPFAYKIRISVADDSHDTPQEGGLLALCDYVVVVISLSISIFRLCDVYI